MGERVIIIGAGQAGAQAAISLRQNGFKGDILMIGAEEAPPYQRPPLSKGYLKGELTEERLYLRPADFYEQQGITLLSGRVVTLLDAANKTIQTDRGEEFLYEKLLLATGAPPRQLYIPGADAFGVCYLRTLEDADSLKDAVSANGRIVIVGAGYIGLEVAAAARAMGSDVTVLELEDRVLARVASEAVSEFYQHLHIQQGVDLRLGTGVSRVNSADGKVNGVMLSNGELLDCSSCLIGVGAAPAIGLAQEAGLNVGNGVVVNEFAQTSDFYIWAAGDCTEFPSARYGRRLRLESVPNAIEQAKAAAANMMGMTTTYDPLPWFWSDQYDVKLQTIGLSEGYDETVMRGQPEMRSFSVWYFKDGALIAVDAINDAASFTVAKRLLTEGKVVPPYIVKGATAVKGLLN